MVERAKSALRLGGIAAAVCLLLLPSLTAQLWGALGFHEGTGLWVPWKSWALLISTPTLRVLWLLLSAALVVGALYLGWRDAEHDRTSFGTAKWRSPSTFRRTLSLWKAGHKDSAAGLVVGVASRFGKVRSAWVLGRDDHTIVLGTPGAGKSTRIILPTLGVLAQSGETVIVTDPKGELYDAAAGMFEMYGYKVRRLDLRTPELSFRWNPLTPVADALERGNFAEATRFARELAQVLASEGTPEGENSKFWSGSTQSLISALALAVASEAPESKRHLASLYHALISQSDPGKLFDRLPPGHPAVQAYGPVKVAPEETRANQLTVAAVSLQIFADPSIAWLTAANEIDLAELAEPGNVVFIVIPEESSIYYSLASLFVHQTVQALSKKAASMPRQRLARPVHFVLDEFGNLPRLPDFEKALAVGRGKGIRITMVLQSLVQLDTQYGADVAQSMRNICNTWLYLSSNDVETAELVSIKAGDSTITVRSRSLSPGVDQETISDAGRRLLTTDEVLRWPEGEVLLLQRGELPARIRTKRYEHWRFEYHQSPPGEFREVTSPELWMPGFSAEAERRFEILDL